MYNNDVYITNASCWLPIGIGKKEWYTLLLAVLKCVCYTCERATLRLYISKVQQYHVTACGEAGKGARKMLL